MVVMVVMLELQINGLRRMASLMKLAPSIRKFINKIVINTASFYRQISPDIKMKKIYD